MPRVGRSLAAVLVRPSAEALSLQRRTGTTVRVNGGVDVHQHLWPPEFVDALRSRDTAPRLVGWTLHLAGEPPYEIAPPPTSPRGAPASTPTSGASLSALSSPLGIEDLRPDDAGPLLLAWHKGVLSLPEPFVAWARGRPALDPDLPGLQGLLDEGFVGLQVPATRLATPQAVEALAEVLAVC